MRHCWRGTPLLVLILAPVLAACEGPGWQAPQFSLTSAAGASGAAGSPPMAPPPSHLAPGTWAIVAKEMDATVVEIDRDGNGHGCQAGWGGGATGDYDTDYCGPVTGHVEGDHVTFDLALPANGHPLHYTIDGTLSAVGGRIGGVQRVYQDAPHFDDVLPGSAVRYLREDSPGPFPVGVWPLSVRDWGRIVLTTAVAQGPFAPDQEYDLRRSFTALGGDVGEFLGSELTFEELSADEVIVHAGPVQKTLNDRPIALTIHCVLGLPKEVEVEMPSGETFLLTRKENNGEN
jgi:hypothetical protein